MKGKAALKARMMAVPPKIRAEVRREMERQATKIVADMKSRVPVDDGVLRDSIGWTWGPAPSGSIALGTVKAASSARMVITIYAGNKKAFYARFQEFGTLQMPANPFFYPTWRVSKARVKQAISRAVRRAVRKE